MRMTARETAMMISPQSVTASESSFSLSHFARLQPDFLPEISSHAFCVLGRELNSISTPINATPTPIVKDEAANAYAKA